MPPKLNLSSCIDYIFGLPIDSFEGITEAVPTEFDVTKRYMFITNNAPRGMSPLKILASELVEIWSSKGFLNVKSEKSVEDSLRRNLLPRLEKIKRERFKYSSDQVHIKAKRREFSDIFEIVYDDSKSPAKRSKKEPIGKYRVVCRHSDLLGPLRQNILSKFLTVIIVVLWVCIS